jgi:hypothetical protein
VVAGRQGDPGIAPGVVVCFPRESGLEEFLEECRKLFQDGPIDELIDGDAATLRLPAYLLQQVHRQ